MPLIMGPKQFKIIHMIPTLFPKVWPSPTLAKQTLTCSRQKLKSNKNWAMVHISFQAKSAIRYNCLIASIIYFTHYAFTYSIINFVVIVKYME